MCPTLDRKYKIEDFIISTIKGLMGKYYPFKWHSVFMWGEGWGKPPNLGTSVQKNHRFVYHRLIIFFTNIPFYLN